MNTTEGVKRIDMKYLRKSGDLCGWAWRTLSWNRRGVPSGSISVKIATGSDGESYYMELDYWIGREEENRRSLKYRVRMESTPCRFGGKRWWFKCPLACCGRRNTILYQSGDYFVCRKCARLKYESQSYRGKYAFLGRLFDAEEYEAKMKRWYYKGKPTRKHRRLYKMRGGMSEPEALHVAHLQMMALEV